MSSDAFGADLEPIEDAPDREPASGRTSRSHDTVRTLALVVIAIAVAVSAAANFRQMRHADRGACAQRVFYELQANPEPSGRSSQQQIGARVRACYE